MSKVVRGHDELETYGTKRSGFRKRWLVGVWILVKDRTIPITGKDDDAEHCSFHVGSYKVVARVH